MCVGYKYIMYDEQNEMRNDQMLPGNDNSIKMKSGTRIFWEKSENHSLLFNLVNWSSTIESYSSIWFVLSVKMKRNEIK